MPDVTTSSTWMTVVEFFDYHCGYCKLAFNTMNEFPSKDWSDVRTIYVEFPILREESTSAARAALAAAKQGKYTEIHNAFMEAREVISDEMIAETARSNGLDVDQLLADMKSPEISQTISRNLELASKIGVSGTPAFLINKEMVSGADMARVQKLVKTGPLPGRMNGVWGIFMSEMAKPTTNTGSCAPLVRVILLSS